jgi:hypothetical protein
VQRTFAKVSLEKGEVEPVKVIITIELQGLDPGEFRPQDLLVLLLHPIAIRNRKIFQERTILKDSG